MSWKEWLQSNTDKFLLVAMWGVCLVFIIFLLMRQGTPAESMSWAREAAGTVLGAILGLITGASLAGRNPPSPPPPVVA